MLRKTFTIFILLAGFSQFSTANGDIPMDATHQQYSHIFHLIQQPLWQEAIEKDSVYYPPTYSQDEFTHATANPNFLLIIGNHFYKDVKADWVCLRMSVESLQKSGVETVFEATAPVGDIQPDFPGTDSQLFPHILGGIHPGAVIQVHKVIRAEDGTFLSVEGIEINDPGY